MQRHWHLASSIVLASAGFALPSFAQTPKPMVLATPSASAAAPADDDVGTTPDEKPEHKEKRRTYIKKMKKQFEELIHPSAGISDDQLAAVKHHWHLSMRLWRIRTLADQAGDKASVAKCDALISKADSKTIAKLKELAAKAAPAAGGTK